MEVGQGIFAVKLCELEQEYGRLQSRIHLFQEKDPERVSQELERLVDEYQERKLLLEERIRSCRSPAVAALAQAQLEFGQRAERILQEDLPAAVKESGRSAAESQAEAVALYAEYAVDFATQAMRYALTTALAAMVLQEKAAKTAEEPRKEVI